MILDKLKRELEHLCNRPDIDDVFSASGMQYNPDSLDTLNRSFFPYGKGVNAPNDIDQVLGGIMIVGADFGMQRDIDNAIQKGGNEFDYNKTFKHLLLVDAIRTNLNKVFFTNYGLGVRKDVTSNTTRSASLKSAYIDLCSTFLLKQIEIIQPKVVVLMSKEVVRSFSKSLEELPEDWSKSNFSFKQMLELEEKGLGGMSKSVCLNDHYVKFVISPHSCDLRNFTQDYMTLLNSMLFL